MEGRKPEDQALSNGAANLPGTETKPGPASSLQEQIEIYEKKVLLDALHENLGHRANTAAMLGIDRKTLYTKMKKYGIG